MLAAHVFWGFRRFSGVLGRLSGAPGVPRRPPESPQRLPDVPGYVRLLVDLFTIFRRHRPPPRWHRTRWSHARAGLRFSCRVVPLLWMQAAFRARDNPSGRSAASRVACASSTAASGTSSLVFLRHQYGTRLGQQRRRDRQPRMAVAPLAPRTRPRSTAVAAGPRAGDAPSHQGRSPLLRGRPTPVGRRVRLGRRRARARASPGGWPPDRGPARSQGSGQRGGGPRPPPALFFPTLLGWVFVLNRALRSPSSFLPPPAFLLSVLPAGGCDL